MHEDSWLEMAYEDRNGSDVDIYDEIDDQPTSCSRSWMGGCDGDLIFRTTSGGFPDQMCEMHLMELQDSLDATAERYPEINHPEGCWCYGCSEGSY